MKNIVVPVALFMIGSAALVGCAKQSDFSSTSEAPQVASRAPAGYHSPPAMEAPATSPNGTPGGVTPAPSAPGGVASGYGGATPSGPSSVAPVTYAAPPATAGAPAMTAPGMAGPPPPDAAVAGGPDGAPTERSMPQLDLHNIKKRR